MNTRATPPPAAEPESSLASTPAASQGNPAVDTDLSEQAQPGHGVPSQDPVSAAQYRLDPQEAAREAGSVLVGGGAVAGAVTGAAIGVVVAGPVGVLVGATVGSVVGAVGGVVGGAMGVTVGEAATGANHANGETVNLADTRADEPAPTGKAHLGVG